LDRVLIVRLGSLGDLVHTLPAVNAIRRAHPQAAIDWLVDAAHREFLDLVPILSSVVTLDRRTVAAWWQTRGALRQRRYEAAIDFQGLLKSAVLARLSGAARVIGFDRRALREPAAAAFYTERVAVPPGGHVIEKNLALAGALGAADGPREFPLRAVRSPALEAVRARGIDRFALLNTGAAWPNKRWPPERFGAIAAWLQAHYGLASIALWGPGEQALAAALVAHSNGAAVLAPETGLTDLVALARAAALVVSGDTGPTHIAAAVGTPVVSLFGPTDPARNGPWRPDDASVSRYEACDCHYARVCRRSPDRWCLGKIAVDDVRAAIARVQPRAMGPA
jgi:heptosyltransferase-1